MDDLPDLPRSPLEAIARRQKVRSLNPAVKVLARRLPGGEEESF